jgi:hypothetical protein
MSTIKSSDEHLTLNADGSSKDIKFQANGVEKASISSSGAFTSTTIDATKLTGDVPDASFPSTLPAASAANLTAIPAANLTGALPAISGANLTGLPAGGLTEADMWKLGSDFTFGSGEIVITSNWARSNAHGFAKLGTGMSQSSGIFTFPSTGIYEIDFNITVYNSGVAAYMHTGIRTTTNNSSYSSATTGFGNIAVTGGMYTTLHTSTIFDVTNTTNCKVRFAVYSYNYSNGLVNDNTYVTFKKLGET